MARKWSNRNLPGALHFVTGNLHRRVPVFKRDDCCQEFLEICQSLRQTHPAKLVAYVLMPDHFHLIVNPRDGDIRRFTGELKSLSARKMIELSDGKCFLRDKPDADGSIHQVWQESFKALPLWSPWMIWQKINYIHSNPVKDQLVKSAKEYKWSSFRSFYFGEPEPLEVDKEWWWPDDVKKLAKAAAEWSREIEAKKTGGSK